MKLLLAIVLFFSLLTTQSLNTYAAVDTAPLADDVLIAQLQTEGATSSSASQEFVLLYNASLEDNIVTNWCLEYLSAAFNVGFTSCIESENANTDLVLSAGGFMTFATSSFNSANPEFISDFEFNGGMNSTSGHLRLKDTAGEVRDTVGWGAASMPEGIAASAHEKGEVLSRDLTRDSPDTNMNVIDFSSQPIIPTFSSGLYEQEKPIDLCLNIAGVQEVYPDGMLATIESFCAVDFCPNIAELQIVAPEGYERLDGAAECTKIVLEDSVIFITEVYANAPGVDTGFEFIELYNPNDRLVNLEGYVLQVGPSFSKSYTLGATELEPGQFIHLSDSETGIVLPNATGASLQLVSPAGAVVAESPIYFDAQEDESWSLFDGDSWVYTNQITPSSENKVSIVPEEPTVAAAVVSLSPCPEGKFRNPETNRCKNIETTTNSLVPCEEDEFRNPLTNRCNKIASTTNSLTPCKPGQVRNPETNRCRSVATAESELKPCDEGEERNPETNRCRKVSTLSSDDSATLATVTDIPVEDTAGQVNWPIILIAIVATAGYMLYEWRSEIRQKIAELKLNKA